MGPTQTDAVLGKRTKWSEMYSSYSERHFVKFENEMRRFRRSLLTYLPPRITLNILRNLRHNCVYFNISKSLLI